MSSQSPGVEGYGEAANSMVRKAEATYPGKGQRPLPKVTGKQQTAWCEKPKPLILGKVKGHCEGTEASLG